MSAMGKIRIWGALALLFAFTAALFAWNRSHLQTGDHGVRRRLKLYWFIPDGFRADPVTMKVFDWAKAGDLPNIRRMMERGSYGYSIPVFPGHTPTNMATLMTGSTPKVHGVSDGSMRADGYPVRMVARNGFSSIAKRVPPLWYTLEERGLMVTLLSVPGSTPPELRAGTTIRGRWGGWGVDFPAVNFHTNTDKALMRAQGLEHRAFSFGPELTKFTGASEPKNWKLALPRTFSKGREAALANWGETVYAYLYDSTDDGKENYDRALFSLDKKTILADLAVGEWSGWKPIELRWQTKNDYNIHTPKSMGWERQLSEIPVQTDVNIRLIKLGAKDFFRVRFFYNNLNEYLVQPADLAPQILDSVGPMVDFVDNYPPQLIHYPEDKGAFLEEADMSLSWHRRMTRYLLDQGEADVVIHNIYTPNQMHTSRWWLSFLDPKSHRYNEVSEDERAHLWQEVKEMYQRVDEIVGEVLRHADADTYVVLSSDHGAVPLYKEVRLNNFFAKKGWLKFRVDPQTGESQIDWKQTRVVYLQMHNIFVNPNGLDAPFRRPKGEAYEKLRTEVMQALNELSDEGVKPLERALKWEDAGELGLPPDRVGDIVLANRGGYNWSEETSEDLKLFLTSLKGGYKQGVLADNEQGMWTPFVVMGPGVKHNHQITHPVRHVDQYPTIMKLLGQEIPAFVEGKPLAEIIR